MLSCAAKSAASPSARNAVEKRGISIGVKQEKVNAAKGLLREGLGIDMISRVTGLSVSEINKLKAAPSAN